MRDYIILAIVFTGVPVAFFRPWLGMLYWFWISIMNPHRLAWGLASEFNIAKLIAIAIISGLIFSRDKKSFSPDKLTILFIILWLHFTITSLTAIDPEVSWPQWQKVSKIFLLNFLTIVLFRDPKRLHILLLVVISSITFFGVKGGIFTLLSGGEHKVWGPAQTFIGGNNEIALAINMILPFLYFNGLNQSKRLLRYLCFGAFFLSIIAIIGTHSRGGLVGLVVVITVMSLATFVLNLRHKLGLLFVGLCIVVGLLFAPQQWHERMQTITTYEEDGSAMGRINAWWFAFNLAKDRPLVGGGFDTFEPDLFRRYAPEPENFHDSHSIIFEILAEHGFVGLGIYLAIIIVSLNTLLRLFKIARAFPDLSWLENLAIMLGCSIIVYVGNGLTLGLAYFDVYWLFIAMVVCLNLIVQDYLKLVHLQHHPDEIKVSDGTYTY